MLQRYRGVFWSAEACRSEAKIPLRGASAIWKLTSKLLFSFEKFIFYILFLSTAYCLLFMFEGPAVIDKEIQKSSTQNAKDI